MGAFIALLLCISFCFYLYISALSSTLVGQRDVSPNNALTWKVIPPSTLARFRLKTIWSPQNYCKMYFINTLKALQIYGYSPKCNSSLKKPLFSHTQGNLLKKSWQKLKSIFSRQYYLTSTSYLNYVQMNTSLKPTPSLVHSRLFKIETNHWNSV